MIDLIIFDCDGVLVDSEILAAQMTSATLAAIGLEMSTAEALTSLVGHDAMTVRRKLEDRYGVALPTDFEADLAARLDDAFTTRLQPIAGVPELLLGLDRPYCVASNSGHERLRRTFATTGLAPLVEGRVFSADDVARGKPAPDLFLHAARIMGDVPTDRCLVIEDSVAGVVAARAAGMRVIGFCGGSHIQPGHDARLLELGADRILTDHSQLAVLPGVSAGLAATAGA
ncbi:HAD-IA family hydrolase [Ancylobacter sonchi]|uniref:HAD-IA family hydrolase n=1 Tax=Ancylobacter sonchi TaxID=1937790 RepID=UPI001BD409EA|nr:HAD-IA family hydrolase [Ancylobacter sonchi]MBS7534682.1 HAD-IA family hydrolase [Ancylobacter sonchi]